MCPVEGITNGSDVVVYQSGQPKPYVLYYSQNRNKGIASVSVKGVNKQGYKDGFDINYHIAKLADLTSIKSWYPVDAQGRKISKDYEIEATGQALDPIAALTNGSRTISRDCLELRLHNNVEPGAASVIVKGKNVRGYKDSVNVSFTIVEGAKTQPTTPETPETPEEPSTLTTPTTPEIPSTPEEPTEPEIPSTPEEPTEPETPATPVATTYTVIFKANGGSGTMASQTFTVGQKKALTANAFKRASYQFKGWNTKANGKGKAYSNKAKVKNLASAGKSVTLYAQWQSAKPYTVKFFANGGTGTMKSQTIAYKKSINLTANKFKRTGYTFTGWTTKANGKGTKYANKARMSNTTGKTVTYKLYAQWRKNSTPAVKPDLGTLDKRLEGFFNLKCSVNVNGCYLDMAGSSTADGGKVQIWGNTSANAQKWQLIHLGGGKYEIVNVNSGKVLDVPNGSHDSGVALQQWTRNHTAAQQWYAYKSGSYYTFKNVGSGLVLDLRAANGSAGTAVQQYAFNGTSAQRWALSQTEPEDKRNIVSSARDIFDAYNDYRASKGLNRVAWDDGLAEMAYNSASGCAAAGKLTHRLGIPESEQTYYSDILQSASGPLTGTKAVDRWKDSGGHRRMMQCDTATKADVGVCWDKNADFYYYAIVYDFRGTNQNGV